MIRKGVYPYEYMDRSNRFDETLLPEKEDLQEDITDPNYKYGKDFETKNLGYYYDLYVQRETLLIADVFESFRNKCVEIYELDPAYFLSAPGLAWQAYLKKRKIELKLLIDYDMLLTVEKRIRGGICHAIH